MLKNSELTYRIPKVCKRCKKSFKAKVHNAKYCIECKDFLNEKVPCKCGCGKLVIRKKTGFAPGHKMKGKTYKQIYGTSTPGCGFKTGIENPNYDPILKEKSNNSLRKWYKENPEATIQKLKKGEEARSNIFYRGEHFNSSYEVILYKFFKKNNFKFEREVPVILSNNSIKVVDFVVEKENCFIYIETTGMGYIRDKEKFIKKISLLRESTDYCPLVILTDISLLSEIRKRFFETSLINVFVEDLRNFSRISSLLNLCGIMNSVNKIIERKYLFCTK